LLVRDLELGCGAAFPRLLEDFQQRLLVPELGLEGQDPSFAVEYVQPQRFDLNGQTAGLVEPLVTASSARAGSSSIWTRSWPLLTSSKSCH